MQQAADQVHMGLYRTLQVQTLALSIPTTMGNQGVSQECDEVK